MAFGKLEREVMNVTWQRGEISVRDVFQAFEERIAYTTLMTTLDRLYRKGILERRKHGRAFLYSPRVSPLEFERGIAQDMIEGLIDRASDGGEPLLACIVDAVSERDRAFLDELDRLVREKKRELRRKH
jgi:predicted transcriptional regulator